MATKINWWLTGVGFFTALIFGTLGYISYRAYAVRGEGYYLTSVFVYGGVAIFSIGAVIMSWRNGLPGQRRPETPAAPAGEDDDLPDA